MPPLVDEDGDSSADEIPFKKPEANGDVADEDSADDDEDGEPDEYVVEEILAHELAKDGTLTFEVKWMGYDDPNDRTWEPEENLATASDVLKAYFNKIGGRPVRAPAKEKKSKKRGAEPESVQIDTPKKRGRKKSKHSTPEATTSARKPSLVDDWKPPGDSWEDHVVHIDTIEESWNAELGKNIRLAYVIWGNGRKTRHALPTLNDKCPQKMLQYYERHLSFVPARDEPKAHA